MSRILIGTICGLIYGMLSAASMIPLSFSDKRAALIGAILNRFSIGFVIGAARLPSPGWASGPTFGILLRLPDAIITKAFVPILILGRSAPYHRAYRWQVGRLTFACTALATLATPASPSSDSPDSYRLSHILMVFDTSSEASCCTK
jgi:hypothetical protein